MEHPDRADEGPPTIDTSRRRTRLGVQLLDVDGRVQRAGHEGQFLLKFDLVAEGVAWFEPSGTKAATKRLAVSRS